MIDIAEYIILGLLGGIASLVGRTVHIRHKKNKQWYVQYALPFAVGAVLFFAAVPVIAGVDFATDEDSKTHSHSSGPVELPSHDTLPVISVSLFEDSVSGFGVQTDVTNFVFLTPAVAASQRDSMGSTLPEGHIHAYINGEKAGRFYSSAFYLPDLEVGDTLRVTINSDDHAEYTHDGQVIATEVVVSDDTINKDHNADKTDGTGSHGHSHGTGSGMHTHSN